MTKFGKVVLIYITCLLTCTMALLANDIIKTDSHKAPIAACLIMVLLVQVVGSLYKDSRD